MKENENKAIIWVASFLEPTDPIYDFFEELHRRLSQDGIDLIIFTTHDFSDKGRLFSTVQIPFHIAEMGVEFGDFLSGEALPSATGVLNEFIASDRAWGLQRPSGQAELDTLRAALFWERAFQLMQPSAILSWGSTAPLSRMWSFLARRFQRPHFFIERGVLEGTLNYSIAGQGCLSDFSTTLSMVDPDKDDPTLEDRWQKIEKYYSAIKHRHYAQANKAPSKAQLSVLASARGPKILYLGSYDVGSGAIFEPTDLGDIHAPWVKTSLDGAQALTRCLEAQPGFAGTLIVKPHLGADFTLPDGSVTTHFFKDIDVYKLIEVADVVVTLTSSTAFVALLRGVPTVTLANIQFMGREVTYEARSEEELRDAIAQACTRTDWDERMARGRHLIAAAFRDVLIGLNDDVPTRFKIGDFTQLVSRFRHYTPPGLPSARDRFALFMDFCAQARRAHLQPNEPQDLRNFPRERTELQRMVDQARLENHVLKGVMSEQEAIRASLTLQAHEAAQQLEAAQAGLDVAQNQLAQAHAIAQNAQQAMAELESRNHELATATQELQATQLSLDHLLRSVSDELRVTRQAEQPVLTTLGAQLRAFEDRISDLGRAKYNADNRNTELNQSLSELHAALEAEKAASGELRETRDATIQELNSLVEQSTLLQQELAVVEAQAEATEEECAGLREEVGRLKLVELELTEQLDAARLELHDAGEHIGALEADNRRLGRKLELSLRQASIVRQRVNQFGSDVRKRDLAQADDRKAYQDSIDQWAEAFEKECANFNRDLSEFEGRLVALVQSVVADIEQDSPLKLRSKRTRLNELTHLIQALSLGAASELDVAGRDQGLGQVAGLPLTLMGPAPFSPPAFPVFAQPVAPNAAQPEVDEGEFALIRDSGLFDGEWYLESYPHVAEAQMDPIRHYIWIGAALGCQPSAQFDGLGYLADNPGVAASNTSPLAHFLVRRGLDGKSTTTARH